MWLDTNKNLDIMNLLFLVFMYFLYNKLNMCVFKLMNGEDENIIINFQ